ncbi:MAG TPA: hypothetical protein VE913_13585 [Longimicrobium sp.]|nr:hypothetical protein [Longimicrobium sp.]
MLQEVATSILPDSFALKGVALSPDGRAVMWAANQPYVLVEHRSQLRVVRSSSMLRPVAIGFASADSAIEVIDAERRSLLRLSFAGERLTEHGLEIPWGVESAARSAAGWVLGGRDVVGNYRVLAWDPNGGRRRLLTLLAKESGGKRLAMTLSAAGTEVLAAQVSAPHVGRRLTVAAAEGSGAPIRAFETPKLSGSSREAGLWISMAILPLDRGYIRTFTDLRSDRRVLVTYDGSGAMLRRTPIRLPMAVIATDPGRRMLLAVRRTDQLELVRYHWRWAGTTPTQGVDP